MIRITIRVSRQPLALDGGAFHRLDGFGFHAISCDGKYPTIRDVGRSKSKNYKQSKYLQVHHDKDGNLAYGEIRTINSALVTAEGRPLLGSVPVPGKTSEQTTFKKAFGDLVRIYGKLFKVVMYDAGAASINNAKIVYLLIFLLFMLFILLNYNYLFTDS